MPRGIYKRTEKNKAWNKGKRLHYSTWQKGKKDIYSLESLKKMSEAKKGKPSPKKTNIFISCGICGTQKRVIPSAKDIRKFCSLICLYKSRDKGLTPIREKIRASEEYKLWRTSVFKRDNYACVWCGDNKGNNLEADHIKPFSYFPKLRFVLSNGRTLCKPCHRKTDTYGWKGYKNYIKIYAK